MNKEHEIVLYQVEDTNICVNVPAISKHLSNIFEEEELDKNTTVSKMEIVQMEGTRNVKMEREYYNLDAIIAVGYRVSSKKATRFRQWATKTLKNISQKALCSMTTCLKDGKVLKRDIIIAKNYLNEKELSRLNPISEQ